MPASGIGTEDIGTAAPWLSVTMPCSPGSSFIKAHGSSPSIRLQSPHLTHRCMPGHATQSRHWSHDHSDACGFAPQRESSITITGKLVSFCSHASKASMNHRIWNEAAPQLLATMRRTLMAIDDIGISDGPPTHHWKHPSQGRNCAGIRCHHKRLLAMQ